MIDNPLEPQEPIMPPGSSPEEDLLVMEAIEEANGGGLLDGGAEFAEGADGELEELFPQDGPAEPEVPFESNLAELLTDDELGTISSQITEWFDADLSSRKEWEDSYVKGLTLLGLNVEERTKPWSGACGITHPLLAEAVVRFQSQTIAELFPAAGPVRAKVAGKITPEKAKQAIRVRDHMNYVLTEEMVEYEEETDRMLFSLPLAGSAFKKIYKDETLGRPMALFVPAEDIVASYGSTSLETAPRLSHILRIPKNELRKMQVSGFYRDCELSEPQKTISTIQQKIDEINGTKESYVKDDRYCLIEMHVDLDLPGFEDKIEGENTGVALPYVVTIEKSSSKVLSIYRNWIPDDRTSSRRQYFAHYQYIPGLGFYGLGLIHLIGGIAMGATSILRQLVDSGTLSNLPAGFKAKGLRVQGGQAPLAPGEWRDVDVPGGKIADHIVPLPYKEPSVVLAELLSAIVEEGRRFASLTDINISSMNQEAPVGTTLALLERNLKVMTAIQKRAHKSMKKELRLISKIIPECYSSYPYSLEDDGAEAKYSLVEDYDSRVDIVPVSDPNSSTMTQRIMQYQSALQLSQQHPGIYKHEILHRKMLTELGITDVEEIVPSEDDIKPMDPVTENMNLLNLDPVKAFPHQDHQAHIQAHMLGMQDPKIQEILQDSPLAQASLAAGMAHVTEHVGFQYRAEIERRLGVPLPPPDEPLPPEVEVELSRLVAQAASEIFQQNQSDKQQAESQEQLNDPLFIQRQKELEIKEQEAAGKIQNQNDRLALEIEKLKHKMEMDKDKLVQQRTIEMEKLRADITQAVLRAASETEGYNTQKELKNIDSVIEKAKQDGEDARLKAELTAGQDRVDADFLKTILVEANKPRATSPASASPQAVDENGSVNDG